MTSKIIMVTDPDDSQASAMRITLVSLSIEQENLVSAVLQNSDLSCDIILYIWQYGNSVNWLLDKRNKSDLVIFNADMYNQTVCGFLSAFKNSYYFGTIKDIDIYNSNCLQSKEDIEKIFIKYEGIYETKFI